MQRIIIAVEPAKNLYARQEQKIQKVIDTCVIRTHAPEGNSLAGCRVNHSAKVSIVISSALNKSI